MIAGDRWGKPLLLLAAAGAVVGVAVATLPDLLTVARAAPWRAALGEGDGATLLLAVVAATLLLLVWLLRGRRAAPTTHGSAHFATRADLADLALRHGADGRRLPVGAWLLAPDGPRRDLSLPPAEAERHLLIVAPPGAGKTRSLVLPNCAAIRAHSFVVTDPKSEAWRLTGGLHARAVRFAPAEPDASACFNWVPACADDRLAALLAEAAMQLDQDSGELFWKQSALVVCAALFAHAARSEAPTPATVYGLLAAPNLFGLLARSEAMPARRAALALGQVRDEVRAAIWLDVHNRLTFLDDERVRRMTSAELTRPDFAALRREPTAVYWCLTEQDIALLRPLSALFWTLLLHDLIATDGPPVTLILDEFGNLGRIPHFERLIAVARGRRLHLVVVAQSLSQLEGVYGRGHARTIEACCSAKVALGGGVDPETARRFAELSGEATRVIETESRRPGRAGWLARDEVGRSQQHVRRTLLTADEVRRLPKGELLAIVADRPPIRRRGFFYDAAPCPGRAAALGPIRQVTFDADEPQRPASARPLRLVRPVDVAADGGPAGEEETEWPL